MNAAARRAHPAPAASVEPMDPYSATLDAVAAQPAPENEPARRAPFFTAIREPDASRGASGYDWRRLRITPATGPVMKRLDDATAGIEALAIVLAADHSAKDMGDDGDDLGDYVVSGLHTALRILASQVRGDLCRLHPLGEDAA